MSVESAPVLQIDAGQCIGCAICVDVCPCAALTLPPTELTPACVPDRCNACADCVRECPTEAILLNPDRAVAAS